MNQPNYLFVELIALLEQFVHNLQVIIKEPSVCVKIARIPSIVLPFFSPINLVASELRILKDTRRKSMLSAFKIPQARRVSPLARDKEVTHTVQYENLKICI
jgi:hypothetical protein